MAIRTEALDELRQRLQVEIDGGHIPSCQFAFAQGGEVLVQETLGAAPADARFAMFSSTKPVVASVVWQLMAEGALDVSQPVSSLWPGFARHGKDAVTLEHVLLHTAGLPLAAFDDELVDDRAARVAEMEDWTLEWEPGTRFEYHALSAHWILAELIALATGTDHRVALRERVLDPLGLDRLELGVPRSRQGDIQPIFTAGERATPAEVREIFGFELDFPFDDSLLVWLDRPEVREAGVPGGGGVSDAASAALFYQALLHDPLGLWDPAILTDVTTNVRNKLRSVLGLTAWRTLGLETAGDDELARFRLGSGATPPSAFGHGGAAGQITWADPTTGASFAFYTNGVDRNIAREWRRGHDINAIAARVIGP